MANPTDDHGFPKPHDDFGTQNPFLSPLAVEERGQGYGYINRSDEPLNPWVSVWLNPRGTIRQIIETDPAKHVILIACLGGMAVSFDEDMALEAGQQLESRTAFLVGMLIGGSIRGLIGVFVGAWVISVTARWLGGVGTAQTVRAASGWSNVPCAVLLPATIVLVVAWIVHGNEFLDTDRSPLLALVWFAYYIAMLVLGIWQFVILCRMVGEVNEFSAWKGLGAILLAGLLIFAVIMIPVLLIIVAVSAV